MKQPGYLIAFVLSLQFSLNQDDWVCGLAFMVCAALTAFMFVVDTKESDQNDETP